MTDNQKAIDIVRQPLEDFSQSLTADQRSRFDGTPPPEAAQDQATVQEQNQAGNLVQPCGGSSAAIDWLAKP